MNRRSTPARAHTRHANRRYPPLGAREVRGQGGYVRRLKSLCLPRLWEIETDADYCIRTEAA